MVCGWLLHESQRRGAIRLPPGKKVSLQNPLLQPNRPEKIPVDSSPMEKPLRELSTMLIRQAERSPYEGFFDSPVAECPCFGYTRPVGQHIAYMAFSVERPVACLAYRFAAWHLCPRDGFIAWTPATGLNNRRLPAYNTGFSILPRVRVPHPSSLLPAMCSRCLSSDRERLYPSSRPPGGAPCGHRALQANLLPGPQPDLPRKNHQQRKIGPDR